MTGKEEGKVTVEVSESIGRKSPFTIPYAGPAPALRGGQSIPRLGFRWYCQRIHTAEIESVWDV